MLELDEQTIKDFESKRDALWQEHGLIYSELKEINSKLTVLRSAFREKFDIHPNQQIEQVISDWRWERRGK